MTSCRLIALVAAAACLGGLGGVQGADQTAAATTKGPGIVTKDGTSEITAAISHPDIYPDEENWLGELSVHIIENSRDSDTFYTLDGTEPSPSINPKAVRYTHPLHFSTPGIVWIRTRAVPSAFQIDGMHIPSIIMEKKYTIKATKLPPPTAQPRGGFYRGSVTIDAVAGTDNAGVSDATIKYLWKDANKQGEATVDASDSWTAITEHIQNKKVGKHFLFLQAVSKSDSSEKSPMSRSTYVITAPLVYDVSTECIKCDGKPTANEYFTVSVQNAQSDSWVFLSYSQRCDIGTKISGTSRSSVDRHMPSTKFRVYESAPAVFVCLEEGGSAFPVVKRGQSEDKHFAVVKSLRDISGGEQQKAIEQATKEDQAAGPVPQYDVNGVLIKRQGSGTSSSTGGGGIGIFLLFVFSTGFIIYLVKVSRATGAGRSISFMHKAVVDDVQRLMGKRGEAKPQSQV